jgi:hypothetical protein
MELLQAMQKMTEASMGTQIGSLASKMEAGQAKAEVNLADMKESLKEAMRVAVSAIEGKMEVIVHSTQSEQDKKIQRRNENVAEWQDIPNEGAAVARVECKEQGPKEMEPGEERQMVPAEEDAVESSRTKKRPRGRRIAIGQRVRPTKLIRGDGESRRKLVAPLQEGVLLCNSGMVEKKHLQGYPDPKKWHRSVDIRAEITSGKWKNAHEGLI